MPAYLRINTFVAAVCLLTTAGCSSDDDADRPALRQTVAVTAPSSDHFGVNAAVADALELLAQVEAVVEVTQPASATQASADIVINIAAPGEGYGGEMTAGSFALREADGVIEVSAPDELGLQYAIYDLFERMGFLFIHPRQTFVPPALCIACVSGTDEQLEPAYQMRGWHAHTMHPIEYEAALLEAGAENLEDAKELVDFYVTQKLNFFQWVALRTVDFDSWIEHATQIVDYAHSRGMKVGIDVPFMFFQQNTYTLIDPATVNQPETHFEQVATEVDKLMVAGWDVIAQEMGTSEFTDADDIHTVDLFNYLVEYLADNYPGTTAHTKVHSSQDQFAPNFGGINFNFIAGEADPRLGVMPHTVQWYDLYRPAPTYDQENFFDMREFLLGEIGERPVYYYPETAYWVTFDIDIPIFLPQYTYARWLDLHELYGTGMDGQINFASGYEWGNWMSDRSAAWYNFYFSDDHMQVWERVCATAGPLAAQACDTMRDYIEWQGAELHEGNGIRWLIAWDAADNIGHVAGIHAQPIRVRLVEVAQMDSGALDSFESDELPTLDALVEPLQSYAADLRSLAERAPAGARFIWDEFALGAEINARRAEFLQALYAGAVARRRAELGETPVVPAAELLASADDILAASLDIAALQEANYRFPAEYIAADRFSYTSYPFGIYRTVPDLYYWQAERKWAERPEEYDIMESLYDVVGASAFKQ